MTRYSMIVQSIQVSLKESTRGCMGLAMMMETTKNLTTTKKIQKIKKTFNSLSYPTIPNSPSIRPSLKKPRKN